MPKTAPSFLESLLACLGPGEKQHFRKWLLSESRGRQTHSLRLYDLWIDHLPQTPPDEFLWTHLFPDNPWNASDDLALRRVKSRLVDFLKRFFAYRYFRDDDEMGVHALLKRCLEHRHYNLYLRFHNAQMRKMNQVKVRNGAYFRKRFELLSRYQRYLVLTDAEIPASLMEDIEESFDLWQLHERLFLATARLGLIMSKSLKLKFDLDETYLHQAQTWATRTDLPLLSLYRQVILLNTQPPSGDFPLALNSLIAVKDVIPAEQKQNCFRLLLNIGIREVNEKGDLPAAKNLLSLILLGIQENIAQTAEGELSTGLFKAMIECRLRVDGASSARKLFLTYSPLLPKLDYEETAHFCEAQFLLNERRYAELTSFLSDTSFHSLNDQVRSRFFLLEAAYELHPETIDVELLKEAQALKRFLTRHIDPLSKRLRKRYRQQIGWLIQFIEKRYKPKQLLALEKRVREDAHHPFSAWLLEKIIGYKAL